MKFCPEKCMVMCISRLRRCDPPPQFRFCGQALTQVCSMKYLGITVDNKLAWKTHVQNVSTKALARLNDIRKFCGTFWGAHPRIVRRLVAGAILPLLYYGSSAWAAALVSRGTLRPLERVLRLSGIITCGLLRTTPTDVAITISGFLFPEIELRQRLIGFWLRSLTYGINISKGVEEQVVTIFVLHKTFCFLKFVDLGLSELFKTSWRKDTKSNDNYCAPMNHGSFTPHRLHHQGKGDGN